MKITFITPYFKNIWESLGVGYISSYLKRYYEKTIDIKFLHGNFDSIEDMIKIGTKSDVVAFSCTTSTFQDGYRLAKYIKGLNPKVCIVFGGWHTTTACTDYDNIIDFSIIGEGENLLLGLLVGTTDGEQLIGNYKSIIVGDKLDINKLEWPDRELIKQERTLDLCEKMCGERIGSFQSRRGCQMSCSFCGEHSMSGKGVRVRDCEDTLNEIEYVYDKYNLTKFKFVDPTWCYPRSAAVNFCNKKIKRGLILPWEGMAHVAFLDKPMLELMKESGCDQINIGVESGSQRLLNDMRKGATIQKIKKVFKWGKELNIDMRGFFVLGMPNETIGTIEQTKQLVREIKPSVFGMTMLTPFPGSDFYESKFENEDWSKCDEYTCDFWETDNFSNEELKSIQKEFNDEFIDNLVEHQKS